MSDIPKADASADSARQRAPSSGGLLASLRQLLFTLLETAQVRLELLGTELEAEKRRVLDALLISAMALVCLALGLVLLCATVILMVPDGSRLVAVGVMALLFLGGGVALLGLAQRRLRNPLGMFHASAKELARDRGQE
jgi:uncharacterized membrane protein YqjE